MELKNLLLEKDEGIVVVTVNRPQALNALNRETVREIQAVAEELDADPEAKIGAFAGWGGVQRLARRVGTAWAMQMNMTGDPIDAQTALRINLTNLVVPHDQLLAEARKIARRIMANAPVAVRLIKALVYEGEGMPAVNALAMDAKAAGLIFATQDQKEGMNAFV